MMVRRSEGRGGQAGPAVPSRTAGARPPKGWRSKVLFAIAAVGSLGVARAEESLRQDLAPIPVARSFNLVGIGVGLVPAYSGANEMRAMVLPVVRLSYRDRLYWNALQGGAWLWDSDDRSVRVGLAIETRFGWRAEDGTRVEGMQTREFSIEGGPAVQWRTSVGVFNAGVSHDLGGASDGLSAQLQWIRALTTGPRLRLNGSLGVQWTSARMTDYYFGVRPIEARAGRPVYAAGSTLAIQAGVNGAFALSERGSVLFGAIVNRLGDAAADSPITETRLQGVVYAGYGWTF